MLLELVNVLKDHGHIYPPYCMIPIKPIYLLTMVKGRYDDGYISGLIKKIKNYQYKISALGANFCL